MHPIGFGLSIRFADVIDAIRCALIHHGERDSIGYIFNVAARPAPARLPFFEQDSRAMVVHALQIIEETMLRIMRAVNSRKTQDRAGQFRIAHHDALDQNLLVVVFEIVRPLRVRAIRIEALA